MTYFKQDVFGLIKAIDNFDINQDVQFSTYGVPMIMCQGESTYINGKTIDRSGFYSLLFLYKNFVFYKNVILYIKKSIFIRKYEGLYVK